jgi:hypothetical protein
MHAMFGLSILTGIGLLSRDGMLKTAIKQSLLAAVLISAFLNFPLLTGE